MNKKLLLLIALSPIFVVARFHEIKSEKRFDRFVNDYTHAVVCFAPSGPEGGVEADRDEKKEIRADFRDVRRGVKAASDHKEYKKYLKKDVGFLLVDSASGRAQEVDEEYALTKFPTCILFKNGQPISAMPRYAQIFDPISKSSILDLLEKHFEEDFQALIKEKKEEQRLEREERLARYEATARYGGPYGYWGWGYGYGYPYRGWGYPYGWRRSYWC